MVKSFTFVKKKPGLTREEFLQYWKEKHAPLAVKFVPGLRKYVQCHSVPGFEFEIDGIVELWFDNPESYRSFLAWKQSDGAKILREDEEKFFDTSQFGRFVAEEHVIVGD